MTWVPVWLHGEAYCCIGCAFGGPCICSYDEQNEDKPMNMKMIMVIMQDEDVAVFLDTIAQRGLRATKICSTGGFLRSGNTTILMGVEDIQVQGALDIIRATCRSRMQIPGVIPAPVLGLVAGAAMDSAEVEVGGANVFVWGIEQYVRV
jgi:uncharacterized protein YaaQ